MREYQQATARTPGQTRRLGNPGESRQRRHRTARSRDHHDVAAFGERLGPVPSREGVHAIAAHDPDNGLALAERLNGVDGVRRAVPPQFDIGSGQRRLVGNGETQHFPSVARLRRRRAVRWPGRENQRDQPYAQGAADGAGGVEVADMHRIECTSKESPRIQCQGALGRVTFPDR